MSANSPTFVAHFADGEVTRMTTHSPKNLDPGRGVRLARHAYRSRCHKEPPQILQAAFERNGAVLAEYTVGQIAEVALWQ
jgi:hypothetical protein